MALRWNVIVAPLFAVACGARSGLLLEDAPVIADGSGGSSSGRSEGEPGSGDGPGAGGGGAPGSGGGPGVPLGSGGEPGFWEEEPLGIEGAYPARASSPDIALAMAPATQSAVFFFATREGSVGQARWFGDEWEPGADGTERGVQSVRRAWIADDGLRSWVSYAPAEGSPSYPLSSEVFSGGLPLGSSTSFQEFQLPRGLGNFDAPTVDIAVSRSGDTVVAFLGHGRKHYVFESRSLGGVVAGFLPPLAAGKSKAGALIGFPSGIYWEEARSIDLMSPSFSGFIDEASDGWFGDNPMVPFGLVYTKEDVAWGAWRIAPSFNQSVSIIRVARLESDKAPRFFELATASSEFAEGGGLAVDQSGRLPLVLWAERFPSKTEVHIAMLENGLLSEKAVHGLETDAPCRVSTPALAESFERLIASAHCSDGSAYLFGVNWAWRLPDRVAGLPAIALNENGSLGFAVWTEDAGQAGEYRIRMRTLTW